MKYKFEDIIYNITEKKKPTEEDKYNYIGLEHLESGNLFISKWGSDTAPEGEKIVMKKGDVLFGKRRAYQKKVAISPVDGIFSAHGMVLRPKENVICKEFLPFFISSETFLNEAIRISVGGLSPTINWKDIKILEFNLPSLEEQKVLAEKLWAAYEVKQSYLKMIEATQEMVKSQFIEMFGTAESAKPLADFIEVSFPGEWGQEDKDGTGVKVIRTTNFTINGKLDLSDVVTRDIDSAKIEKKKLSKGDIILERSGGTNDNPVGRVVYFEEDGLYLFNNFTQLLRCKEGVNSLFIFYSLFNYYQMNKNVIRSMGNKTTGIQNLKMDRYWQIPIADVSIERQKEFETIYRQADKSGFELRKSIDAIDKVIKSLINENL
jgi:type I restriction enzyme S subunit